MMHTEYRHGGDIFGAARNRGGSVGDIYDFSASINPLGPPPAALAAIKDSLGLIQHYPDPRCGDLRRALSVYLGVPEENMLPGNGASELIYLLARVIGCRKVVVPQPTFIEYAEAVTAAGGTVTEVPMREEGGFALPVVSLIRELKKADAIFICNPNNPTGRVEKNALLRPIVEEATLAGKTVVVDEAFMDFVTDARQCTVLPLLENNPGLVVLYSLTKFFAVPGLRLGVAVASAPIIKKLETLKDPWSVNILAQVAGTAALSDREYMEQTRQLVQEEREFLCRSISLIPGLSAFKAEANYLLVKITRGDVKSTALAAQTAKNGVLVRDCSTFSGLDHRYIRVAVRSRRENIVLLEALRGAMEGV